VEEVDEGGRPRLRGKDDGDGDDNWREGEMGGGGKLCKWIVYVMMSNNI